MDVSVFLNEKEEDFLEHAMKLLDDKGELSESEFQGLPDFQCFFRNSMIEKSFLLIIERKLQDWKGSLGEAYQRETQNSLEKKQERGKKNKKKISKMNSFNKTFVNFFDVSNLKVQVR